MSVGKTDREEIEMYFQAEEDEFTLSAFTETGQAELSIEVPEQRSYTGGSPAIPCSLADTPRATLGVLGVANRLNAILGTSTTSRELRPIIEHFIERNYDFGTAYAILRPVWNTKNPSNIQDELRRREGKDRERPTKSTSRKPDCRPAFETSTCMGPVQQSRGAIMDHLQNAKADFARVG